MSDLLKRLRECAQVAHMAAAWGFAGEGYAMEKAADRIEELELEVETWKSRAIHQNEVAGRLEAKLEKVVEALGILADDTNWFDAIEEDGTFSPAWRGTGSPDEIARTTIAELTGGGKDGDEI